MTASKAAFPAVVAARVAAVLAVAITIVVPSALDQPTETTEPTPSPEPTATRWPTRPPIRPRPRCRQHQKIPVSPPDDASPSVSSRASSSMAMTLFRIILLTEVISCSGSSQHPAPSDDPHAISSRLQLGQDGEPCENDASCENFACAREFATVDSLKVCCLFWDYVYASPSLGFVCTGQEEGADCLNNHDDLCLSNVCVKGVCLSDRLPNGEECDSNADCFNFKCGRVTASIFDSDMICCPSDSYYFVDFLGNVCGDQDDGKPSEPTPTPSQEPTATQLPTWPPSTSWPTVWSECRLDVADTPCPELSYCDDSWGGGGDCISCDAIPAGPLGCENEYGNAVVDACIDACSPSWHICSEAAPCPDGSFCTFESDDESKGYCFGCNGVPDPQTCFIGKGWGHKGSLSEKGREGCISSCFQEIQECSEEERSCLDGSFCNYMYRFESEESSGFCSECAYFDSLQDCSELTYKKDKKKRKKGAQSCSSVCFGCSADNPCQDDWFCDYRFGENGYCTTCVTGDPIRCTRSWTVSDTRDPRTESCLNTCFDTCSLDTKCSDDGFFCDFQLDDTGYCASCNATVDGDPFQCSDPTEVPEFGEQSCLDTCFYQCSSNVPCPNGSFCTSTDHGHCMDCELFGKDPKGCLALDISDRSKEICLSSCFQMHICSEAVPCPDGTFCTFASKDRSQGYCFECDRVPDPLTCVIDGDFFLGLWWDESLSPKGSDSCISSCFQEIQECSEEERSCLDGSFCNYMYRFESEESSGFCSECELFDGWYHCAYWLSFKDHGRSREGAQSCSSVCFGCSADNPCQDGWFCDYRFGDDGYCTSCDEFTGDPMSCTESWIIPESAGLTGTESCLNTCFDTCSLDIACSEDSYFCDFSLEDTGYCASCNATVDGDPLKCLALDISDLSKEICLSSCFVPCTLADDDCADRDYYYCVAVSEISSETGYCKGRDSKEIVMTAKDGPKIIGSKFSPNIGQKEVEEILQQTTPPTASPRQETKGNVTKPAGPEGSNPLSPSVTQEAEGDAACAFCANDVMLYPERNIRAFYDRQCLEIKTRLVPTFAANSRDCQVAELNQHICGCSQTSYAGADTYEKQIVLAWLPRCMAILSALGSIFIIADIACHKKRRSKTFGQLMLLLSSFDLLASIAYAFTSLPIPAEDYIHGAHGNEATCTAQGFFIAMGSVACYTNVSLAFYYLLMLKMGWSENTIKKRARLWLFVIPVAVGLIFAFAGIPFYDSIVLWCSNASNYWPDIPVAVAIAIATVVMGVICYHVYKEEKASAKWRAKGAGRSKKNSMASMVAWQSAWYLAAFYLVWPPYLALQYMWASGRAYDQYGFTLAAGTLVPMQGFWNAVVYLRPRLHRCEGIISKCFCPSLRGLSSMLSNTVRMNWASSRKSKASSMNDTLEKSVGDQSGTKAALTDAIPNISGEMSGGEHASERDDEWGEDGGSGNGNDEAEDLIAYTSLFCSGDSEADEQ